MVSASSSGEPAQRSRWSPYLQRFTRRQRPSATENADSMMLVEAIDLRSSSGTRSLCTVRVSSIPYSSMPRWASMILRRAASGTETTAAAVELRPGLGTLADAIAHRPASVAARAVGADCGSASACTITWKDSRARNSTPIWRTNSKPPASRSRCLTRPRGKGSIKSPKGFRGKGTSWR